MPKLLRKRMHDYRRAGYMRLFVWPRGAFPRVTIRGSFGAAPFESPQSGGLTTLLRTFTAQCDER